MAANQCCHSQRLLWSLGGRMTSLAVIGVISSLYGLTAAQSTWQDQPGGVSSTFECHCSCPAVKELSDTINELNLRIRSLQDSSRIDCRLLVQPYSATAEIITYGNVTINDQVVWNASFGGSEPNKRGINTINVDPFTCTAVDIRRFDTCGSPNDTSALIAYIQNIHDGSVIIGVTGDEPILQLPPALPTLRAYGILVEDVQWRGNFAFVIQKGYAEKTAMVKSPTNSAAPYLRFRLEGSSVPYLKIIKY